MATESRLARVLVVAADEVAGDEVVNEIKRRAGDGAEMRVIAPALTESRFEHHAGAVDEAREQATERLERSLGVLRSHGIEAAGEVGDSDLRLAIQDALQTFSPDEILIVAHREDAPPLEHQGIAEAERSFPVPITELFVTHEEPTPHVAEVEHTQGKDENEPDPGEVHFRSHNLPPYSPFDLASIVLAIIGTGVLVVLAASCGSDGSFNASGGFGAETSSFDGCDARLLIAGLVGLINLAHVVGLILFQSGPYRGVWRKVFSWLSLVGTPVAIVVSLLLG